MDWILAEDWWPYQRPTFVAPPFAGYVSGHSTFSRAAAEVMTLLTGDSYFPGGMGEFNASRNEFLVFEEGPSMDVTLQWATYRDASDQCSLSRIWGGIHPPADDIPGRLIGEIIGVDAFTHAEKYFENQLTAVIPGSDHNKIESLHIYPNPLNSKEIFTLSIQSVSGPVRVELINNQGQAVWTTESQKVSFRLPANILPGLYTIRHISANGTKTAKIVVK